MSREAGSVIRNAARVTAVVVTAVVGSAIFVALFMATDSENDRGVDLLVIAPALLGAVVALAAAGRDPLLGTGTATFVALGVLGLIVMGSGARAEGGMLLVIWVVGTEVAGLYATAGIWRLVSRIKSRAGVKTE